MKYVISFGVLVLFSFIYVVSLSNSISADSLNPGIYSIDSKPFGIPYQDYVGRWWNWSAGIPSELHPRGDSQIANGENPPSCNMNQAGPVWFLPDILQNETKDKIIRHCDVPFGKAIFVPVITGGLSRFESPTYTDKQLMESARECDDLSKPTDRGAELDGVKIRGLDDSLTYRTNTSKIIHLTFGKGNIYNVGPSDDEVKKLVDGGMSEQQARTTTDFHEGWFLFLEPLSEGKHTLHIKGAISSTTKPTCNSPGEGDWMINVIGNSSSTK